MKIKAYIRPTVAALMVLSLFSCRKAWDYIEQHPPGELKICNIQKISDPNSEWKEAVFSYNLLGNPVKVLVKNQVAYDQGNLFFKYDAQNRLSVYASCEENDIKPNSFFNFYHKYSYQGRQTIVDSMFVLNWLNKKAQPQFTPGSNLYVFTYSLDNQERISKIDNKGFYYDEDAGIIPAPAFPTNAYKYDVKGNMVESDSYYYNVPLSPYPYDKKVNIRRTNKIWMFINRDYSSNNPLPALTYNVVGLPLKIRSTAAFDNVFYPIAQSINLNSSTLSIEYSCDVNSPLK